MRIRLAKPNTIKCNVLKYFLKNSSLNSQFICCTDNTSTFVTPRYIFKSNISVKVLKTTLKPKYVHFVFIAGLNKKKCSVELPSSCKVSFSLCPFLSSWISPHHYSWNLSFFPKFHSQLHKLKNSSKSYSRSPPLQNRSAQITAKAINISTNIAVLVW